jgi:SAM-dependent methyltransferase
MAHYGNRIDRHHYVDWLQKPSAQRLLALEAGWLGDWLAQLDGEQLLYAGADPSPRFLRHSPMSHRFTTALPWQPLEQPAAMRMNPDAWPLMDQFLDLVVLQHTLDMSRRPHQLVREASRCLVSSGYLIIVGFNPWSLWGAQRWLRTFSSELPWLSNTVSAGRLCDWLTLLDFRIECVQNMAHVWPIKMVNEGLSRRIDRVLMGRRWLPGSTYMLVARKTIAGVTRIRTRRWRVADNGFTIPAPAGRSPLS